MKHTYKKHMTKRFISIFLSTLLMLPTVVLAAEP